MHCLQRIVCMLNLPLHKCCKSQMKKKGAEFFEDYSHCTLSFFKNFLANCIYSKFIDNQDAVYFILYIFCEVL